jgi:predicted O-linked N-acetylglucosamine transferase (SPINDLY family)
MSSIIENPKPPQQRQVSLAEALQIAVAQHRQGAITAAEDLYQQILRVDPNQIDALHLLGIVRCQQGRLDEAEPMLARAIQGGPDSSAYANSWGRLLLLQGRRDEALVSLRRALELSPQNPEAYFNLAEAELAAQHFDEAIRLFEQTLILKPVYPEARFGLAQAIRQRDGWAAAIAHYQLAAAQAPDIPVARYHLGVALQLSNHLDDALKIFVEITQRWPEHIDGWIGQAATHFVQGRLAQAITSYEKALEMDPNRLEALDGLVETRRRACDWRDDIADYEHRLVNHVEKAMETGQTVRMRIFTALYTPFSPAQQLFIAQANANGAKPVDQHPRWTEKAREGGRIRVGYMIADVRDHPNAHNTLLLYGLHDRDRFEIFTYSWGPDDSSAYRKKIMAESEHFIEMKGWSDEAMAQRIAEDGVQILVDLMAHTGDNHIGVLARCAAPIQVNYLGFPCTSGADYIDYILGDPWVTPQDHATHFAEKIVQLPWSYQINSHRTVPLGPGPRRTELGLPNQGFVFCCFNNSYKIDSRVFGLWMEILEQVPGSVLWLYRTSDLVDCNLRQAAEKHGMDPARLIFAPFLPRDKHLQRLQAADLFLDTDRYNAHTTTSDALWAGVPLLTVPGQTFASRVAASLLRAAQQEEGILTSWDQYVPRAVHMARHPEALALLRAQLRSAPEQLPIFDTPGLVAALETAYATMWQHFESGHSPEFIVVPE